MLLKISIFVYSDSISLFSSNFQTKINMDQEQQQEEQEQEKSVIQVILESFCDCSANSAEDSNCKNLPNCFFKNLKFVNF